jgi:hypothetical protein
MPYSGSIEAITFTAGEALADKRRVQVSAGSTTSPPEVVYADATEEGIGLTEYAVDLGELVTVRPYTDSGKKEAVAADAIAVGDVLYAAVDGKVDVVITGAVALRAFAITATSADGDYIEIINY